MTAVGQVNVTVVEGLGTIDGESWDALARSFYSSRRWLEFACTHGDAEVLTVVADREGELVGVLPLHVFRGPVPSLYHPGALFSGDRPTASDERPLAIAGTRQGYETEVLVAERADAREITAALVSTARSVAADVGAGEPWLMYAAPEVVDLVRSAAPDARSSLIDARARVEGFGAGLNAYRNLLSDNGAARMRKERAKFERSGLVMSRESLAACAPEMGALSGAVLRRYGHDISDADESDRFRRQVGRLDDSCILFTARTCDGSLVGFTQFFRWRDQLVGRVHGLDDNIARSAALYYNLTYYGPIAAAPDLGVDRLDLGCDSFEAKVRRGAVLEPLHAVTFGQVPEAIEAGMRKFESAQRRALGTWEPSLAIEEES